MIGNDLQLDDGIGTRGQQGRVLSFLASDSRRSAWIEFASEEQAHERNANRDQSGPLPGQRHSSRLPPPS